MALESATYISDLVTTNPGHTDLVSTTDSHIRMLKSVLKATFPGITGAVTVSTSDLNGMVASVALKAPIAYPAFTGSVSLSSATDTGFTTLSLAGQASLGFGRTSSTDLRWSMGMDSSDNWFMGKVAGGAYSGSVYTINYNTALVNFTNAPLVAGQAVWHGGNFAPSNYAALAGINTFTNSVTFQCSPTVQVPGALNTGAVYFGNTGSRYIYWDGGAYQLGGAGSIWHSGNLTPGNYALLSGATFTGDIKTYRAGATSTGAVYLGNSGAYLYYDGTNYSLGGNIAWHAGNFNPANYASLGGATFTGGVSFQAAVNFNGGIGTPITTSNNITTTGGAQIISSTHVTAGNAGAGEMHLGFNNNVRNGFFYLSSGGTEYGLYDASGGAKLWYSSIAGDTTFYRYGYATTFYNTSDRRLKHDIAPIENGLGLVSRMQGVTFTYNAHDTKSLGLIAQDLQEIVPDAVSETPDGTLTIAYGNLVGVLVEAIKELKDRVETLESKVT